MKISKFNTTSACNVPQTLRLADPFTGQILVDEKGKTLDFQVLGIHSDAARNAVKQREQKYGKNPLTEEEAAQSGAEFLASVVAGWSGNIEDDNGPIQYSRENAIKLFKAEDWLARQVQSFCMSLEHYSPKKLSESAPSSVGSHGSTQPQKNEK